MTRPLVQIGSFMLKMKIAAATRRLPANLRPTLDLRRDDIDTITRRLAQAHIAAARMKANPANPKAVGTKVPGKLETVS